MILRRVLPVLVLAVLATITVAPSAAAAAQQSPVTVYALTTDNRLLTLDARRPQRPLASKTIFGLQGGETLVGIDRRPKDGQLWGVGRSAKTTRLYTLDQGTGRASLEAVLTDVNGADLALYGSEFGVDFNPAADALRIVSDGGQNLRALPEARTVAGVARPKGATFIDGPLNAGGAAVTGVAAAAYTNNDTDPGTLTTLYVIDTEKDTIAVQDPPNDGTLTVPLRLTRGTTSLAGFDIAGADNSAYAVLTNDRGRSRTARLVRIELNTGRVRVLGTIARHRGIRGLAL